MPSTLTWIWFINFLDKIDKKNFKLFIALHVLNRNTGICTIVHRDNAYIIADAATFPKLRSYRSNVKHWLTNWRFIHTAGAIYSIGHRAYTYQIDVGKKNRSRSPSSSGCSERCAREMLEALSGINHNSDTDTISMEGTAIWAHRTHICWRGIVVVWRVNMCTVRVAWVCACKQ